MATKTKKPAKKTAPVKKAVAKAKAVKTKATKTVKAKAKSSPKPAPKKVSRPAGPREQKLASGALKLIDEAASILRSGVRETANTTEKSRLAAKKRAHGLLTKATSSLGSLLDSSSSALHNLIGKV